MDKNIDQAVKWLLRDETGDEAQNDPSRKENVNGLSNKRVGLWTGSVDWADSDFTPAFAAELLLVHVWHPCGCDLLPSGLDYWTFDLGYRFSPVDARRWLCLAAGLRPEKFDPRLLEAMMGKKTPRDLILEMDVFVRRRQKVDPQWDVCKHWWTNRSNRARDRAIKLSRES